jgi:uncharacterized protein YeaO (DUF488 family)
MSTKSALSIKRVYLPAAEDDGWRILVDRLWPRGLRKDDAAINEWLKEVAPSPELLKWFAHDPAHWAEFQERYRAELQANPAVEALAARVAKGPVTLLYAAHDEEHNHALVLAAYLLDHKGAAT